MSRTPSPFPVYVLSLTAFMLFWALLAHVRGDPHILPSPVEVAQTLWSEITSGRLFRHLWATALRMGLAFTIAMTLGSVLGVWLGRHPKADLWATPWVTIFLNMPALVLIVLCYLWIGLTETAVVAAVTLNKTALVTVTLREGARVLSQGLDDMAFVFGLTPVQRLRHVQLPQLAPFLLAAARSGLAMIWKVVLVAEFLGRSSGIGFQIHLKFQMFDIAGVLAYALAFVAVMLTIEFAIFGHIDGHVGRWRTTGT